MLTEGITGSPSQLSVVRSSDRRVAVFYPMAFPKELYEVTTDEGDLEEYSIKSIDWTNSGIFYLANSSLVDLKALRNQSGLQWRQLASLFGVSKRIFHYWVSGDRKISAENRELAVQLSKIVTILDRGASFRTRQFLEANLLGNKRVLRLVEARDFFSLEKWARELPTAKTPTSVPISRSLLNSRLPSDPVLISTDVTEVPIIKKKVVSAKLARKKKP